MIAKVLPIRRAQRHPDTIGDEALVAACSTGDTAALAGLFDRFSRDVHRFLVRLRGVDDHVVDDLVQETFLAAYGAAGRYRRDCAVRTWLLAIAANLARNHVRGEMRRRGRDGAYLEKLGSEDRLPETESERRELIARLPQALSQLSDAQRAAFLLCDVEGVRGIEAANALGIRPNTLYRRLHDARRALGKALLGGGS